jgi:hypothetical protein
MKLYLVWGIEFHDGRHLFGVYESMELANVRLNEVNNDSWFDEYKIQEIELNTSIE